MKTMTAFLLFLALSPTAFAAENTKSQVVNLEVTEKGFEPSIVKVTPGSNVTLKVTRKTDATCAKAIQIPSRKVKKDLPLNQAVFIELGKLEKGEVKFACGMSMLSGAIVIN